MPKLINLLLALVTAHAVTTRVDLGTSPDGSMTPAWSAAVRDRHDAAAFGTLMATKKPLDAPDKAWAAVIAQEVPLWSKTARQLGVPFAGITAPPAVSILIGNRGGDDGFTHGLDTIALDTSALARNYGVAGGEENRARLHRILSHEYTHLVHKAWLAKHPQKLDTPLRRALWECLYEGFGTYRSLSSAWITPDGKITTEANKVLAALGPTFADRLSKLAKATPAQESELRRDLSNGAFRNKWGALPMALWLAAEAAGDDRKLAKWVDQGPSGVLELARKHLPAKDRRLLEGLK